MTAPGEIASRAKRIEWADLAQWFRARRRRIDTSPCGTEPARARPSKPGITWAKKPEQMGP